MCSTECHSSKFCIFSKQYIFPIQYKNINLSRPNKTQNKPNKQLVYYDQIITADVRTSESRWGKKMTSGERERERTRMKNPDSPEGLTVTVYHANRPILAEAGGWKHSSNQNPPAVPLSCLHIGTYLPPSAHEPNRKPWHLKGKMHTHLRLSGYCTAAPDLTNRGSHSWYKKKK